MVARIGWPTELTADDVEDEAILASALETAVETVWALSGRRFGAREATVRPCSTADDRVQWTPGWYRGLDVGFGYGSFYGSCAAHFGGWERRPTCGCSSLPELALPRAPVMSVSEVTIDGEVLDEAAYRVERPRWLVRLDGERWPACQTMSAGLDEEGSFGVTFQWGYVVPEAGKVAVQVLGAEVARYLAGSEECALPERITNLNRNGVSMVFDPQDFLDKGRTGLRQVDAFLAWANPNRLQSRGRVFRADAQPTGRMA